MKRSPFALVLLLAACARGPTRPTFDLTQAASKVSTGSPATVQITDADKTGFANGLNTASYTGIDDGGIRNMQTGSDVRNLWFKIHPDGTRQFNLSSGTDIEAEGVEYDPGTGLLRVGKFGTSASAPLRATNEAIAPLAQWWMHLTTEERTAFESQLRAVENITPSVVEAIVKIASGGVAP